MKTETIVWTIVLIVAGVFLLIRAGMTGMGTAYVGTDEKRFVNVGTDADPAWVDYDSPAITDYAIAVTPFEEIPREQRTSWTAYSTASMTDFAEAVDEDPAQDDFIFSWWRTLGIWVAAFFTLAIFSFLYKDNPFYKIAESVVVGVSAAYWMVVGFWDVLVPNLFGKLLPGLVQAWAMPGLSGGRDWWYIVPLILGILLLMRLSPKGAWLSRWPLAFIIGTTAGIRLVGFIHADFLSQIRNSIVPIIVTTDTTGTLDIVWESLRNILLVIGVLSCLVYFFFSFEHKGLVGKTARLGIWFLMITFGAAFGYTVMGRIALLAIRIEFLVDDWLWLIDPTDKRPDEIVALLMPALQTVGMM